MKKELEGILGREGTQPCVKTGDGKTRLVYNILDGFTGKKVKFTIEEITEEEMEWADIEEESEILEGPEIDMGEEKVTD
jgi:hypothetical protein